MEIALFALLSVPLFLLAASLLILWNLPIRPLRGVFSLIDDPRFSDENTKTLRRLIFARTRSGISGPYLCKGTLTMRDGSIREFGVGYAPDPAGSTSNQELGKLNLSREMTLNAALSGTLISAQGRLSDGVEKLDQKEGSQSSVATEQKCAADKKSNE